jgi:hypothetical protein
MEPSTEYRVRCSSFQLEVVGLMVRHLDWGGHAFELVVVGHMVLYEVSRRRMNACRYHL